MKHHLLRTTRRAALPALCAASLLNLASPASGAAPAIPANDSLLKATPVTGTDSFFSQQAGPKATAEKQEPAIGGVSVKNTVWYRFIAPYQGALCVSLPDQAQSRATIWRASKLGRTFGELVNDVVDYGVLAGRKRVVAEALLGQVYLIQVDSAVPVDVLITVGRGDLDRVAATRVFNVDSISGGFGGFMRGSDADENVFRDGYRTGWIAWQPVSSGKFVIDTLGSKTGAGKALPTQLCIYQGDPVTGLVDIAQGSDLPADFGQQLVLEAEAGETYLVAVGESSPVDLGGGPNLSIAPMTNAGEIGWGVSQQTVSETTGSVMLDVCRFGGHDGAASCVVSAVNGSAVKGSDFVWVANQTVNFAAGERVKTVFVPIVADAMADDMESFTVQISNVQGAQAGTNSTQITIQDGTSATSVVSVVPFDLFPESDDALLEGFSMNVTLQRTGDASKVGAVWVTGPGIEGGTQKVVFTPGQTFANVWLTPPNDLTFTAGQFLEVYLENPEGMTLSSEYASWGGQVRDNDPCTPLAGRYAILAVGPKGDPMMVEINVTSTGAITGKARNHSASFPIKGAFDKAGLYSTSLVRKDLPAMTLDLSMLDSLGRLRVVVQDPATRTGILGADYPVPVFTTAKPTPYAGLFNSVSDPLTSFGLPLPLFASAKVLPTGKVTATGVNLDNTPFTFSADITSLGKASILVPTHGGKGYVTGTIGYHVSGNNSIYSSLRHFKPANSKDAVYPGGYDFDATHRVCRYTPPAAGGRALTDLDTSNGAASAKFFQGEVMANDTTHAITVDGKNKVTGPAGQLTMTITPATGVVTGNVKGTDGKMRAFRGVVFNAGKMITGNVAGPTTSGQFTVKK